MTNTNGTSALAVQTAPISPVAIPRSIFTMNQEHLERMKLIAQMVAASRLTYSKLDYKDKATEGELFLVMLKGVEIGLEPLAALDLMHIIQGKPTLSPQGMLALIHQSGNLEDMQITDDGTTCTVKITRRGMSQHIETFSQHDADAFMTYEKGKQIKLSEKHNWQSQPAVMRKWRAISAAMRVVFPDIIQGLYTPEEIDPNLSIGEDGNVINTPSQPAQQAPVMVAKTDAKPTQVQTATAPPKTAQIAPDAKPDPDAAAKALVAAVQDISVVKTYFDNPERNVFRMQGVMNKLKAANPDMAFTVEKTLPLLVWYYNRKDLIVDQGVVPFEAEVEAHEIAMTWTETNKPELIPVLTSAKLPKGDKKDSALDDAFPRDADGNPIGPEVAGAEKEEVPF